MKIQIHKNCFKEYYKIRRWNDVPEFLVFRTIRHGQVQVVLDDDEKKELLEEAIK